MSISFIVEVKIIVLIKWSYKYPSIHADYGT
jgi:hypothetical protein